jgi:uncharacterized membrane protein YdjX (TVP38/TMEM64 family)
LNIGKYAKSDENPDSAVATRDSDGAVIRIVVLSIGFVALLLLLLWFFDIHHHLLSALEWIDQQGAWSAVLFIAVMALVVVLLLPGVFFTTGAGFVFGIAAGTLYVVLGTTLGAALAFLIARHLLGGRVKRALLANKRLGALTNVASQHDFQVVLLTRLIPFFPGKVSNYVFGLTGFSFRHYLLASLIGFIPYSLHNVYLGSLAADLASVGAGEFSRTPLQWVFYGMGFVAIMVALVYFSRLARRGLSQFENKVENPPGVL